MTSTKFKPTKQSHSSMSNLDVAVSSFWQLARHWKQGDKAKLELGCEDGSLHMQLTAVLGHPDHPHFPYPPSPHTPPPLTPAPSPPVLKKKKSPSQLRRQERRRQEALARAEEAAPPIIVEKAASTEDVEGAEKDSSVIVDSKVESEIEKPAEKLVENLTQDSWPNFKCDQCEYTNATERGLSQHQRMKHRISQLDGNLDSEGEDPEEEKVVTLILVDNGDIIGPELCPKSFPPTKVFHPKAGIGILEKEHSKTSDGDVFINYYFPDDPKTYVVTQGPNRGLRMPSIYNVFLI